MRINTLLNLGCEGLAQPQANKVKIMNVIAIITMFISATYTSYYGLVHNVPSVALINGLLTVAYAGTLVLNNKQHTSHGKIWFFAILMLHLMICTNVLVTNESGFHLYFFLVPTGAFLLFELRQKKEKILLSAISIVLFLICENTLNPDPLIKLDAAANHLIYQSVVLVIMLEVIVVMTLFVKQIEIHAAKLTHQANSDSLTGVANRRHFFEKAQRLLNHANLKQEPFAIIIIDFDNFKRINDQHGHFAGDLCLIEVCQVLNELSRSDDCLARLGGEEFVIALPNTSLREAYMLAENMRKAIENKVIPVVGQQNFSCTASFGISCKTATNNNLQQMLIEADKALYNAKENGRNVVNVY